MKRQLKFWTQVLFVVAIAVAIGVDARATPPSTAAVSGTPATQTLAISGPWQVVMCSNASYVHKAADDSLTITCPSDPAPQRVIVVKPCHTPKLTPVTGGYALSC